MNTIIPRLTEFENDIKLLKKAILVLENNFSKIKNDIIETCNEESNHINIKKDDKKKNIKKDKDDKKCKKNKKNVFKKCSILILNNNIKTFFTINSNDNKILVSDLNIKINKYLIEKNLIKNKKVYLNKELKTLLKTKKRIIELDEILKFVINCNVV